MGPKRNIYVIYASPDRDLAHDLIRHFQLLEMDFNVSIWHDQPIYPKQPWKPQNTARFNQADIFLLLVSNAFMYSEFVQQNEFKMVIDRYKDGRATVVPVLLDKCPWDTEFNSDDYDFSFKELQVLPEDKKPMRNWDSLDDAVDHVTDHVRRVIAPSSEDNDADMASESLEKTTSHTLKEQQTVLDLTEDDHGSNAAAANSLKEKAETKKIPGKEKKLQDKAQLKAIEEKKLRETAEIKKKALEAQKIKEKAEAHKIGEEENRLMEEAEAKRIAFEKRNLREEAEARKRVEQELKLKEEALAKERIKEEQMRKEEAEAKKKVEEQKTLSAAAEVKKRAEEEKTLKEKAAAITKAEEERLAAAAAAKRIAAEETMLREKALAKKRVEEEKVVKEDAEAKKIAKEEKKLGEVAAANKRAEQELKLKEAGVTEEWGGEENKLEEEADRMNTGLKATRRERLDNIMKNWEDRKAETENHPSRKKVYVGMGIGAFVIFGIWVFSLLGPGPDNTEPTLTKTNTTANKDSIAASESKVDAVAEGESISNLGVGDTYKGGLIFIIDQANKTGKIAYPKDSGPMPWNSANSIHEQLGEGWRLPTLDELRLMQRTIGQGATNSGQFADELYWSATPYDTYQARLLRFRDGNASYHYNKAVADRKFYVRAVRDFSR